MPMKGVLQTTFDRVAGKSKEILSKHLREEFSWKKSATVIPLTATMTVAGVASLAAFWFTLLPTLKKTEDPVYVVSLVGVALLACRALFNNLPIGTVAKKFEAPVSAKAGYIAGLLLASWLINKDIEKYQVLAEQYTSNVVESGIKGFEKLYIDLSKSIELDFAN